MLEIAEPTVRWTLHAARKRLRVELAGWKEQHDE
jgi:DNA-directed RNA polymerase specialized sigma24 family protein